MLKFFPMTLAYPTCNDKDALVHAGDLQIVCKSFIVRGASVPELGNVLAGGWNRPPSRISA